MAADGASADERLTALIALYNEQNNDARWQEECRERSASAIIAANSIIVGIIAAFNLQFPFILFCLVQYVLAGTGQKFILKYHALSERRHAYVKELQRMIQEISGLNQLGVDQVFAQARKGQHERLKGSSTLADKLVRLDDKTSIHELWYALHSGFKFVSVLLAIVIVALDVQRGASESVLLQMWHAAIAFADTLRSAPQAG